MNYNGITFSDEEILMLIKALECLSATRENEGRFAEQKVCDDLIARIKREFDGE